MVPELCSLWSPSFDASVISSHSKSIRGGGNKCIQPSADKHGSQDSLMESSGESLRLIAITPNYSYCASEASETEDRWMWIDDPKALCKRIKGWKADRLWRRQGVSLIRLTFLSRMIMASFGQDIVLFLSTSQSYCNIRLYAGFHITSTQDTDIDRHTRTSQPISLAMRFSCTVFRLKSWVCFMITRLNGP